MSNAPAPPPPRLRAAVFVLAAAVLGVGAACAPGHAASRAASASREASPPLHRALATAAEAKFEGDFAARLRQAGSGRVVALIDLTEQLDLDSVGAELRRQGRPKSARRQAVIGALERVAGRQQALVQPVLDRMVAEGRLHHVIALAIVNRLVVEGTAGAVLELAELPEVARIMPDWTSERRAGRAPDPDTRPAASVRPPDTFRSWAIAALGADRLWQEGLDGTGVVVASLDTGAHAEHEQLAGRRLPGARGWFDPVEGAAEPYDNHGHGTSVLAQAVGGGMPDRVLGIAPGARWSTALANWHNHYSRVRMSLAADWALRVARPDVLINAWSHAERCSTFDLAFVNAWKAAEIFVIFPAGNAGPAPGSGESPADLGGTYPDGGPVLSVGGLAPDGQPFVESSRGPSSCGSPAFPMLAAPGAALPFAFPAGRDGYGLGNGTSLAAGLVGGAAALLLQADPEMSPAELEAILVATARDVMPPGRDDASGAGALDLPAALAAVRARRAAREAAAAPAARRPRRR